jgi:hypothetical protein
MPPGTPDAVMAQTGTEKKSPLLCIYSNGTNHSSHAKITTIYFVNLKLLRTLKLYFLVLEQVMARVDLQLH